jgi:hypothetical protein
MPVNSLLAQIKVGNLDKGYMSLDTKYPAVLKMSKIDFGVSIKDGCCNAGGKECAKKEDKILKCGNKMVDVTLQQLDLTFVGINTLREFPLRRISSFREEAQALCIE